MTGLAVSIIGDGGYFYNRSGRAIPPAVLTIAFSNAIYLGIKDYILGYRFREIASGIIGGRANG